MNSKTTYELIDHTADFGIQVFGHSAKNLFQNAALALMDQLLDSGRPCERQTHKLIVEGRDWPDLMVNWLREILYLWDGENQLTQAVQIDTIAETELTAFVETELYSRQNHAIKTEIKAVTYHQIQVSDMGDRWEARIIFDI